MRLNMWMIVNRLQVLEPQLHLLADSPAEIRGVRPYQADHYAYVSEKNGDAWCSYGEEYFVLPSLSRDVALGLVQDVFEFYNTWEEQTLAALGRMDFQSVIDSCSPILSNPLVLLDANYKVMAMSSRYGEEEVDREWAYLSRNGFSSIKAVKGLRSQREDNLRARERNPDAILRLRPDWSGYVNVSCSIQFDRIPCGSLVIIEKERLVNKGDVLFAGHLCRLLSSYLNKITFSSSYTYGTSVFYRLMNGQAVDEAVLQMQMVYYDWKTDDPYRLLMFRYRDREAEALLLRLLRSALLQNLPTCVVEICGTSIFVVVNTRLLEVERLQEKLADFLQQNEAVAFLSLERESLFQLCYSYDHLRAMDRLVTTSTAQCFYRFEDYAVQYILRCTETQDKLMAVYPPFRKCWQQSDEGAMEILRTIRAYLLNNESIALTAQQLYLHRNTLVYRLKKAESRLQLDFSGNGTRLYYLLSLELLETLGDEWKAAESAPPVPPDL